jgi:hypothetical protein
MCFCTVIISGYGEKPTTKSTLDARQVMLEGGFERNKSSYRSNSQIPANDDKGSSFFSFTLDV